MRKLWELLQRVGHWCAGHKAIMVFVIAVFVLSVPFHYIHAADSLFTKFLSNPIDVTMITLAGIIQVITGAVGKLILLIIEVIVIPVLGYNGFYNSHITNLGWSLVRDVVNMFVVVILLVIAIMTIIGYSKANWTQQLPKLFIAIVLVNFSKLICGFLIDVSQVIMFTFVNAIVSIAAGNFASMLSMNTFGQFGADFIDSINETGTGLEAFEFLMGAYLQFIVILAILGVMFLLAAAFIWRIVVLWILIIMSPLAFFLIGVKDIFHAAESSYTQWWSKFTSALTFGPTMVFFLWLALAASSGSNLAQTEDFPMPDSTADSGISLEMFSLDNFLGMFLALAILIAGMQQASASAQAMGGFASKMLSEDMGKGLVKGLARPMKSAKSLSRGAASQLAKPRDLPFGLDNLRQSVVEKGAKGMANAGVGLQKAGFGAIGGAVSGLGGYAGAKAAEGRAEMNKAGAEEMKYRTQTDDQKKLLHENLLNGASTQPVKNADGTPKIGKDGKPVMRSAGVNMYEGMDQNEAMAMRRKFLTSPDERKKIEDAAKKMHSTGPNAKSGQALTDAVNADMDDLKNNQMAFADSDDGKRLLGLSDDEKKLVKGMKMENLHLIEPKGGKAAYQNADGAWKTATAEADYNKDKQKAMKTAIDETEGYNHKIHSGRSLADANVRAVLAGQSSGRTTADGTVISALDDLKAQGNSSQKEALRGSITAKEVENDSAAMATVVNSGALVSGSPNASPKTGYRGDVAEAVRNRVVNAAPGAVTNTDGLAAGNLLASRGAAGESYTHDEVLGAGFAAAASAGGGGFNDGHRARAGAMVSADPANAGNLDTYVPRDGSSNEVTHLVANSVDKEGIKKLQTNLNAEANPEKRAKMQQGLETVTRAVKAERAHAMASGDTERAKKMKALDDQASEAGGGRYGSRASRPAPVPRPPRPPRPGPGTPPAGAPPAGAPPAGGGGGGGPAGGGAP